LKEGPKYSRGPVQEKQNRQKEIEERENMTGRRRRMERGISSDQSRPLLAKG
jgi:hypothetical protein